MSPTKTISIAVLASLAANISLNAGISYAANTSSLEARLSAIEFTVGSLQAVLNQVDQQTNKNTLDVAGLKNIHAIQ